MPVPALDLRSKADVSRGGSSELEVGLTAAQHIAATSNPSATGGWVNIGYLEGGSYGRRRTNTEIYDEAGVLVKNVTETDEWVITNVTFQDDDDVRNILTWMEDTANAVPVRYRLPHDDATKDKWVFLWSATRRIQDWDVSTQNAAVRGYPFELVGSDDGNGNIGTEVLLSTSQTEWPSPTYDGFKDGAKP